jgi:hypothetical protein
MKKSRAIIILIAIFLTGCASQSGSIYNSSLKTAPLNGRDFVISIQDDRRNTDNRFLDIPVATLPGQQDKINPKLYTRHKNIITEYIHSLPEGKDAGISKITVQVLHGSQEFSANWYSEFERVLFSVLISIEYDDEHTEEAVGTADGIRQSTDASPARAERMYETAIKYCIADALSKIN